jgi:hypothetical protein
MPNNEAVNQHFDRIQHISDNFRKTLEAFAADGVIDSNESQQVKRHLIDYREQFKRTRAELVATEHQIRDDYNKRIMAAAQKSGETAHEVSRLRLEQYHALRPFDLLKEMIDRMLEVMANVPRPSYDAARDMHKVFVRLADRFRDELADEPNPHDTQIALASNVVEMQLADKVRRWERLLADVQRRVEKADESPLQRVYLRGMQAALEHVLADARGVASDDAIPNTYDSLLSLDYDGDEAGV